MSKKVRFVIRSFYRLGKASHHSERVEIEFFVQEIFLLPIYLTIAQELTENDDFEGRTIEVRMSKIIRFMIRSFYRRRMASHHSGRVEMEFLLFRRYLYHQFI